jgi:hypothetical protein
MVEAAQSILKAGSLLSEASNVTEQVRWYRRPSLGLAERFTNDLVHGVDRHGFHSFSMQDSLEIHDVDRRRSDDDRAVRLDEEVNLVASFQFEVIANFLRNGRLSLASQSGCGHSGPSLPMTWFPYLV